MAICKPEGSKKNYTFYIGEVNQRDKVVFVSNEDNITIDYIMRGITVIPKIKASRDLKDHPLKFQPGKPGYICFSEFSPDEGLGVARAATGHAHYFQERSQKRRLLPRMIAIFWGPRMWGCHRDTLTCHADWPNPPPARTPRLKL